MKKNVAGTIIKWIFALIVIAVVVIIGKYFLQGMMINDDINGIYADEEMLKAVDVGDVSPVKLEISCGYAVVELMTDYFGEPVTESAMYAEDGEKITTSTASGLKKTLEEKLGRTVTLYENAKSSEILRTIHEQLSKGIPVPICYASSNVQSNSGYELHYSVVTGMDLNENLITVYNVYGYYERHSVSSLLDAMNFKSFENMPIELKAGEILGIFNRNTFLIVS